MSSTTTVSSPAPKTPLQEFWFYFKQNHGAVIGLTFIAIVFLVCVFAGVIAPLIRLHKIGVPYCYLQLGLMVAIVAIY